MLLFCWKFLFSPNNIILWLLEDTKFLFLCSTPCFNISQSYLFLTFSVKTFYGVSLISWKKWIWNDTLNLLKFVIWFQKQISCFVEYKNDKERKMAKGKSWVEINCKQRIKKQIAIKLENLRGSLSTDKCCFRAAWWLMWDSSPAVESSSLLQGTVSPGEERSWDVLSSCRLLHPEEDWMTCRATSSLEDLV